MHSAPTRSIAPINLFELPKQLDSLKWEPFRTGVKIHRIYGNQTTGPSAAFLWYEPGAGIPAHEHLGYEHIFILSHPQTDEHGEYAPGTMIINPPGSTHTVSNAQGGVVLAIWEKPVMFIDG
ncbi:MAG TPA: cupin domain-containing protein [Tepidisphaeraceae bacterium]|nr:cupin domain-containing protein [Tepidisphaeraceae bacterium]